MVVTSDATQNTGKKTSKIVNFIYAVSLNDRQGKSTMIIEQRILTFVTRANWVLLLAATVVCGAVLQPDFTGGIIAGGLIVTINFHLLYRTLEKSFTPPYLSSTRAVVVKYYLRFIASIIIIYILVSRNYVNPGGLLIGLSIVVVSITAAGLIEARKIIFKEAV